MGCVQEATANKVHGRAWCTDHNLAKNLLSTLFSLNRNRSFHFETLKVFTHDLTNT